MQKIFTRSIPNQDATRQLVRDLCKKQFPEEGGFTIFLEGSLGAGKTFVAKEIMERLGVEDDISSPTYALVNEYNARGKTFAHWDFYRLEEASDFFARGFQDLASDHNTIHLVEWAERLSPKAKSCFHPERYVLKIEFGIGVGLRKVKLLKTKWLRILYS